MNTDSPEPPASTTPDIVRPRWLTVSFLAQGTILFAASLSVVKKLVAVGVENFIGSHNPISYCNVLFAGNLVAAVTFAAMFPRDLAPRKIGTVETKQWFLIALVALLEGAIGPTFIFLALMEISVASIFLIESVKIPLVLLIAWLVFGERANSAAVAGATLATIGIVAPPP